MPAPATGVLRRAGSLAPHLAAPPAAAGYNRDYHSDTHGHADARPQWDADERAASDARTHLDADTRALSDAYPHLDADDRAASDAYPHLDTDDRAASDACVHWDADDRAVSDACTELDAHARLRLGDASVRGTAPDRLPFLNYTRQPRQLASWRVLGYTRWQPDWLAKSKRCT